MRIAAISKLPSDTLVREYAEIGIRQDRAIEQFDNRTYNRLYSNRKAIAAELQSRAGDHRMLLLPLLDHANRQVRLNAGQELLKLAPQEARRALQAIADSNYYPHAANARMSLDPEFFILPEKIGSDGRSRSEETGD